VSPALADLKGSNTTLNMRNLYNQSTLESMQRTTQEAYMAQRTLIDGADFLGVVNISFSCPLCILGFKATGVSPVRDN
jgi:hypothetical protein